MPDALENIKFNFSKRQTVAYHAIQDPEVDQVMYGGAKGGGKSVFLCIWVFLYCLWVIKEFKLKPTDTPIPIGWIGRLKGVHFKDTTLQTWFTFIPKEYYENKKGDQEIIILGCVKIDYGGLDTQEAVEKFNSAEYAFIAIDQAEECSRDTVAVLLGSRRRQIKGVPLPYKALFTANPAQCWLKNEFVHGKNPNKKFIQALPSDNEKLPASYIATLTDAFKYRPELLAAYLDGSWDALAAGNQIILDRYMSNALLLSRTSNETKKFISCDPARFGDDETVMYLFEESVIKDIKVFGKISSDRLNNELHRWALQEGVVAVVIEENGIGGPICDWQCQLAGGQYTVIPVDVAKASNSDRYANIRAEMWFNVAEMFDRGDIPLSEHGLGEDDLSLLKSQLCEVSYDFMGAKLKVESKKDIKDRINRSPDRADAAIIGWYKWPEIRLQKTRRQRAGKRKRRRSSMAS